MVYLSQIGHYDANSKVKLSITRKPCVTMLFCAFSPQVILIGTQLKEVTMTVLTMDKVSTWNH